MSNALWSYVFFILLPSSLFLVMYPTVSLGVTGVLLLLRVCSEYRFPAAVGRVVFGMSGVVLFTEVVMRRVSVMWMPGSGGSAMQDGFARRINLVKVIWGISWLLICPRGVTRVLVRCAWAVMRGGLLVLFKWGVVNWVYHRGTRTTTATGPTTPRAMPEKPDSHSDDSSPPRPPMEEIPTTPGSPREHIHLTILGITTSPRRSLRKRYVHY